MIAFHRFIFFTSVNFMNSISYVLSPGAISNKKSYESSQRMRFAVPLSSACAPAPDRHTSEPTAVKPGVQGAALLVYARKKRAMVLPQRIAFT